MRRAFSTAVALACAVGAAADSHAAPARVVSVHIVSKTGDDEIASDVPKRAIAESGVVMYAVLGVAEGRAVRYYSDAGRIRLRGRTHQTSPLTAAPPAMLLWYKVEPATENLSNTASGSFRFEPIDYAEVPVGAWMFQSSVRADVRPTITTDRGNGFGTMRYKLVAVASGDAVETPGAKARRPRGSGGLSDAVHRISLRPDNTYLGYLTEMYGQPYIWASGGRTDTSHQSERLEGSDCADFVVYGWRRLGHQVPYTWTGGLGDHTRRVGPRGTADAEGVYRDERGQTLAFGRPGDLILFPRHVGVLVADRGVPGVLDHADILVHTLFESPHPQAIGDSGYYAGTWAEIRRWLF